MENISPVQILKTGLLPKNGGEYALVLLSAENIDQILSLQETVFKTFSEREQGFLLKKDRAFFEEHFSTGNLVLGIVHQGRLIAQSIVVNPTSANPKTGVTDINSTPAINKITLLQGVIVHPDYQGNRLMSAMVDAWLVIAKKQGRTHALTEVAVDNTRSWANFLKEGLRIHSIGTDPSDGTQLYNICANVISLTKKRLRPAFNKKSGIKCPRIDLEKQKNLLAAGYKGVGFDPANGNIEFKPFRKPSKFPKQ